MKKLLIILSIITLSFSGYSQEREFYFKNVRGEVTWQKVFESELQKSAIKEYFQNSGLFKEIEFTENGLTGELRLFEPDHRGAGYSVFKASDLIYEYYHSAFVSIQFKESRYRVTINKITLTKKNDNSSGSQGSIELLNGHAITNKGLFGRLFIKNSVPIYDYTFLKMFEPKNIGSDDDW
ncbi:hypothetical protein DF185_06790 [Marinifilum breve]|uniref:DUF4468 domain-containing protein n=1 Tax=Marinifilum breve TaxID=2184082 RepID=A0A2V4A0U2_9BACT|nr:hypothetical protein [Marinifilum breve]PXY02349.1 hypothetical protein DF185_06790 [Marinifilum breve]